MERPDSIPKLSSPSSAGAYQNYYKADTESRANPTGYQTATDSISKAISSLGVSQDWLYPTLELVARESSFNPNAKNPTSSARGLFQFLDGTRADYGGNGVDWNDPYQQSMAGLKYIKDRYGSPEKALQFWDKNNWY
jgi:soluble lytic murein transglycosylase-like protein